MLLFAFDQESLVDCLRLGFPCYNGTQLLNMTMASTDVTHSNPVYMQLMWAKPTMINAVLQRNYTVHYSDLDTVWLRDVRSLSYVANEWDADVIAMDDMNGRR